MDAMGFGMGCSCLQLTFQSCNIKEARRLYDALVPVAPIMVTKSEFACLVDDFTDLFVGFLIPLAKFVACSHSSKSTLARVHCRCRW